MYSLMVSANPEAWNGAPFEIELGRVLREFTAAPLTDKYGALNDADVAALMRFPVLFAQENANRHPARIGWITCIRHRNNMVRVEYVIEPDLPPIEPERLLELQWELDLTDWEMNRTHWALKDIDLLPVLVEKGVVNPAILNAQPPGSRIAAQGLGQRVDIPAQPRVFRLPATPPEPDLVSVMMPFAQPFDFVYQAIQGACTQSGLRCVRADNIWQESEVIQDIFSLIFRSKIVVCDFTHQNPNVFYETGIAHTLGKHVIPIAQNGNDVPFDLRHHRYLTYAHNEQGLALLTQGLAPRLRTLRDLA